ncbi:MAG: tape measure protein [Shewanella sp.]
MSDAEKAASGIGGVNRAASELSQTMKGVGGLTGGIGKIASAAAGLASVSAAMSKLVSTARQFDQLNAGLLTMTGSGESAALAFAELEKFAAKTPYTLDQSVQGFTKLVALGLNPSQKAMESYGNTAAAMGKDLSQMIEAVADAATGEFERLKEFGIKSKQQGDKVSFTFQGVTTTVGKNAAEIEGYLQSLGENQFAGAMANRMATLDGALSNLQDSWDGLFRSISSQGAGQEIEQGVRVAIDALDELTAMISSGELVGNIKAWGTQWQATMQDVATTLDDLDRLFTGTMNGWGVSGEDAAGVLGRAFSEFPANIRASIQIATTYLAGFIDKVGVYANAAASLLDPRNMFTSIHKTLEPYQQELERIDGIVLDLNVGYLNQRDTAINSFSQQTEAAKRMRAEFDLLKSSTSTDLGQFKVAGDVGGGESPGSDKKAKKAEDAAKRAYDAKIADLAKEQQAEEDAYQRKLASAGEFNARMDALDATELEKAANDRSQRMIENQMYFNNGLISEEQYQLNLTDIKSKYTDERIAIEENELRAKQMLQSSMLGSASGFFDGMAGMAEAAAGEQSGIYRATFALSKGFATAKAALDMQMAISDAMSKGFPQNIPLMAQAASAGAQIASTIGGLNYSGAYDKGGYIPAGSFGVGSEKRDEFINGVLVKGPARITGGSATEKKIEAAANGGGGGDTYYITQNITGNGDEALAKVIQKATKAAVDEVQRDAATNGRIRKTLGV